MVIVPQQSVHRTSAEHALAVVVRTSPYLVNDILCKRVLNQLDQVVIVNHVKSISVI
jgi:hypothetical protein